MNVETTIERFILDEILLGSGPEKIDPDEALISSRILDSLALLRLISFIEERLGVVIEDEDLIPDNFQTINTIKDLISSKQPA